MSLPEENALIAFVRGVSSPRLLDIALHFSRSVLVTGHIVFRLLIFSEASLLVEAEEAY